MSALHYALESEPEHPVCGRLPKAIAKTTTDAYGVTCKWCLREIMLSEGDPRPATGKGRR